MQQRHPKERRAVFNPRYVPIERRRRNIFACIVLLSIIAFFLVQRYVIAGGIVKERSMLPTLKEDTYFVVNKYIYLFTHPQRGDIVILRPHPYDTDQYIKRLIAVEGDLLEISDGRVYLNGQELEEPYAVGLTYPNLGPMKIPKDRYFVMGDNRPESQDSRHFGVVALNNIKGKVRPGKRFSLR